MVLRETGCDDMKWIVVLLQGPVIALEATVLKIGYRPSLQSNHVTIPLSRPQPP